MIINNASLDDSGEYECKMRQTNTCARLLIEEREIKAVSQMKDTKVPLNGIAIFETILNSPNAEAVWKKNGKELSSNKLISIEECEHPSGTLYRLTMRDQKMADSGEITFNCARNQCKQSAKMEVLDLPLGFTKELEEIEAKERTSSVLFECHPTRATAEAIWYCGSQRVTNSDKYEIIDDGFVRKLVIKNLTREDNYEVKCIVNDKGNQAQSSGLLATRKN